MECPRCGATNDDSRSSCSECYSPLKGGTGVAQRPAPRPAATAGVERPRQAPRATYRPASSSSSGGSKAAPVILIIVLLALAAGWWFFLFNPSPISAAKTYVDTQIKTQGIDDSKAEFIYDSGATINGGKAEVPVTIRAKTGTLPAGIKVPDLKIPIVMVKEGSIVRKQWRVDEQATQAKALEAFKEFGRSLMSGMPGMR